jgi:hypothetical protein
MIAWPCVRAGVIGLRCLASASSKSRLRPPACAANSSESVVRTGWARIEDVWDMRKKESMMKKARMLATSRDSWRILGRWMFEARTENNLGRARAVWRGLGSQLGGGSDGIL